MTQSKTLVFLHPHFLKPGGASRVVLEQASRLQNKGFYCPIVTTLSDPQITSPYPSLDIYSFSSTSTSSVLFWLFFPFHFLRLANKIKNLRPDYIYCHSLAMYWGIFYKLFSPKSRIIVYFHDIGFPYFDSTVETNSLPAPFPAVIKAVTPIFALINKLIILKANHLIANSRTSASFIFQKYRRHPEIIVYPGFDHLHFKPNGKKERYLITAGRLEKIKNVDKIIRSLKDSVYKLKIAGDGTEMEHLRSLAVKYGISKNIDFLGNVSLTDLPKIYSQAVLGIFMSPAESFGLTAVECLACGTPVIGINQNGIKEIVTEFDDRFLVGDNPQDLRQMIQKVLDYRNFDKLTQKAVKSVAAFAWDVQINNFVKWLATIS